jgi:hypothetical protein
VRFAVSPAPDRLEISNPLAWRVHQVNDSPVQFKWRYALGIGLAVAAAAAATLVVSLATASAQSDLATTETGSTMQGAPPVTGPVGHNVPAHVVNVEINHKHPIAGKAFRGLTVTFRMARTISSVECDAKLAHTLLRAPQRFFVGPQGETVVCRWRIPPHTGGKRLRLSALQVDGRPQAVIRVPGTSWIVKKR